MKSNNCDEHDNNDDCSEGDVDDGVDCDGCRQKHIQSQVGGGALR